MEEISNGNVVFIQSKPGFSKVELTKKLSDALEILGIARYILLIDVYVEELLGRRPTSAGPAFDWKKLKPRFPVLEPLGFPRSRNTTKQSKQARSEETQIQYQVIHAYAEKIHRLHLKDPWVLLVECSFQTRFDYAGLQLLSEKFDFTIHWLPTGTRKEQNAKFHSIVAQILGTNETKKHKATVPDPVPPNLETLHQNQKVFDGSGGINQSKITFDDLDVDLQAPPFFTKACKTKSGNATSASYTSLDNSEDSLSSESEIEFDNEALQALLELAKRLPPPDPERYITIGEENPENNIRYSKPLFVVLVRDIFPGPASNISFLLKEALRRKGINSKRLTVSSLFIQPKAITLMKQFSVKENGNFQANLSQGCTSMLLNILHIKLSIEYRQALVLIVDLEEERYVRIFSIMDFCIKLGIKTLILEKKPDGSFECNFNKVLTELKRGCIPTGPPRSSRARTLKLPMFNVTFLKEFLPFDSCQNFADQDSTLDLISMNLSSELRRLNPFSSIGSNAGLISPTNPAESEPRSKAKMDEESQIRIANSNPVSFASATLFSRFSQQVLNFLFQKSNYVSRSTTSEIRSSECSKMKLSRSMRIRNSLVNLIGKRSNQLNPKILNEQIEEVKVNDTVSTTLLGLKIPISTHTVTPTTETQMVQDEPKNPSDFMIPSLSYTSTIVKGDNLTGDSLGNLSGLLSLGEIAKPLSSLSIDANFNQTEILPCVDIAISQNLLPEGNAETKILDRSISQESIESIGELKTGSSIRSSVISTKTEEKATFAKLSFPRVSLMCAQNQSTTQVQNMDGQSRSLIEIIRLPEKKRLKIDSGLRSGTSEESLFKGWVGRVNLGNSLIMEQRKSRNIFLRIISSIQTGFLSYVVGPFRKAFKQNRVTPSNSNRDNEALKTSKKCHLRNSTPFSRSRSPEEEEQDLMIEMKVPKLRIRKPKPKIEDP